MESLAKNCISFRHPHLDGLDCNHEQAYDSIGLWYNGWHHCCDRRLHIRQESGRHHDRGVADKH